MKTCIPTIRICMNKPRTKKIVLWVLFIISVVYGATILHYNVKAEMALIELENKCIQHLISKGVERRDIDQGNGECWVKGHRYASSW